MASSANLVLDNFYWRIEAITPTSSVVGRRAFRRIDTLDIDPAQSSGLSRGFRVAWVASDEEHQVSGEGITDGLYNRAATHTFEVEVYYSTKLKWTDLHTVVLSDRHDLTKQLRDPDTWVGYNASNTTTDIGIYDRIRESDELDTDDPGYWVLRQSWRVIINEVE